MSSRLQTLANQKANVDHLLKAALYVSILGQSTDECMSSKDTLTEALTNPPLFIFPKLDKPFILHVDASPAGLEAVLLQFIEDKLLHLL